MAVHPVPKQPSEEKTIQVDWSLRIPALIDSSVTFDSATAYAYDNLSATTPPTAKPTTTLSAIALAGATTVSLGANPAVGALLTVNAVGANAELLKVTAVAGGGPPYVCTIAPVLHFEHASGETVEYYPGVSAMILESPTAELGVTTTTIVGRRGVHGHTYRVSIIAALSSGDIREGEIDLVVSDE